MKKTKTLKPRNSAPDDLRPEYRLDYRKSRPNRFAGRAKEGLVVVLDPDIFDSASTDGAADKRIGRGKSVYPLAIR